MNCYIVSTSHSRPGSSALLLWRPNCAGFTNAVAQAGQYSIEEVRAKPDYYNRRKDTIAVPCAVLDALAQDPLNPELANEPGVVIRNTPDNWAAILSNQVAVDQG